MITVLTGPVSITIYTLEITLFSVANLHMHILSLIIPIFNIPTSQLGNNQLLELLSIHAPRGRRREDLVMRVEEVGEGIHKGPIHWIAVEVPLEQVERLSFHHIVDCLS